MTLSSKKDLTLFTGNQLSKCITEMRSDQSPWDSYKEGATNKESSLQRANGSKNISYATNNKGGWVLREKPCTLASDSETTMHQVKSVLFPHRGPNVPCLTLWTCYYKGIHLQVAFSLAHVA